MHDVPNSAVVGSRPVFLCASSALVERGEAVPIELLHWGRAARGFVVRYEGRLFAYLNQCTHVPMEMDYQPNRFFDSSGEFLMCATHGALYSVETGACRGGPCRGGLTAIGISEEQGSVYWHTAAHLQPA